LLLAAGTSQAFELRAWPLFELERRGTETEAHAFGPIVEWHRDDERGSFALRPLVEVSRAPRDGTSRGSFLYPLASWQSSSEELSVRFFGVGSYVRRATPLPDRPYTREFRIFPFVFYHRGPSVGASLSVVPLYANLEHFFGYERVQMLLFPLFLKLSEPLYERTWLPFPFFSRVGGRAGEGVRVWPVYGHTVLGSDYESTYLGWPFYIRAVEHPGREGAVTTRISWPFFSSLDGPTVHSRSYAFLLILPLYTHTIDLRTDTEIKGFPWPFWTTQTDRKSGERLSLRLTPLYESRRTAALESKFYFWPFYRRRTGLGDSASYERSDVLFVFYRDQLEPGDPPLHIHALVPLGVCRRPGDGQALTLLDGMFPKNEALQTLYAPLYRIFGRRLDGSGTHYDALWRMWTWGDGKLRPPWYWSRD
jgi:hypothetical protein